MEDAVAARRTEHGVATFSGLLDRGSAQGNALSLLGVVVVVDRVAHPPCPVVVPKMVIRISGSDPDDDFFSAGGARCRWVCFHGYVVVAAPGKHWGTKKTATPSGRRLSRSVRIFAFNGFEAVAHRSIAGPNHLRDLHPRLAARGVTRMHS